ncbi:MAG: exodeoxyribonuclease III [Chryseotalea sp.]|jgi:exodeoxyribonuclease-3|nr:exodeoxyribonuclease III [Flammeovirgaceae bacterium]
MKIISYNINGMRAALQKDFANWCLATNADIVCLQEVKALQNQVNLSAFSDMGYSVFWHPAERKGYSGVAILSKEKVNAATIGCGEPKYDSEGRVLQIDTENYSVLTVYMPSGSSSEERQKFKLEWLAFFSEYIKNLLLKNQKLIINGDFNVCHQPIDIHNPIANWNTPGFTQTERDWFTSFLTLGFTDGFRHFNKQPHQYSWWSYRAGARNKNLGWRIDYQLVTNTLLPLVKRCVHLSEARHSDHCPVLLEVI